MGGLCGDGHETQPKDRRVAPHPRHGFQRRRPRLRPGGGAAGLLLHRHGGRVAALAPETFTVSVAAPDRRLINKGSGGVREAVCRTPEWPKGNAGLAVCTDASGGEAWLFNDAARTYTRSYLFGTPLATEHTDPNITVAHGTCRPY